MSKKEEENHSKSPTNAKLKSGLKFVGKKESPAQQEDTGQQLVPLEEEPLGKITYAIPLSLIDKIKQDAYWARVDDRIALIEALQAYYEDKHFEPIPPDAKRNKGGRPKKISQKAVSLTGFMTFVLPGKVSEEDVYSVKLGEPFKED